jgi:integrase
MENIKVYVIKFPDRKNMDMRYRDPTTSKFVRRSTGTSNRKKAEKIAAKWEAELQEGRYKKASKMPWQDFVDEYDRHILTGMKKTTAGAYYSSLNVLANLVNPLRMSDITTARITAFVTKLREQNRKPATVARHLRTLKVIFGWAKRQGYLVDIPEMQMPKYEKGMRGRPIVAEEFDRLLVAVPKAAGELAADSYRFYLRGLWTSGLRLQESLALRWVDGPDAIVVDLSGRRPMLRIPAQTEKGNTHRMLPMAPELYELLMTVPEDERHGRVFKLLTKNGTLAKPTRYVVGPRVREIGKIAGVVTNQTEKNGKLVNEFASAHDLRRSFGFRWSRRVMPAVLKELMRHESIETTMKYYVGVNAEATADELWAAVGSTLGSTSHNGQNAGTQKPLENK